jgi:N-acetylneuraminate synthase
MPLEIIAEAGVNHNGDIRSALKLVEAAHTAGADTVKFQMFNAEKIVTRDSVKAEYQKRSSGGQTQFEMLKELELSKDEFKKLNERCDEIGINFLCTPFDSESLDFLLDEVGIGRVKISSGDLTNLPLIHRVGLKSANLLLSTGMSNLSEIELAINVYTAGLSGIQTSEMQDLDLSLNLPATLANEENKKRITLLHCTSDYPAEFTDLNLNAIKTLRERFHLNVGYSDHSVGIEAATAVTSMGVSVIEKHITLDKSQFGPDHAASLDIKDFQKMVLSVRNIEKALGKSEKVPTEREMVNSSGIRRGIYASQTINRGEVFSENNLIILRPETTMPVKLFWNLIGKVASKDYSSSDPIEETF